MDLTLISINSASAGIISSRGWERVWVDVMERGFPSDAVYPLPMTHRKIGLTMVPMSLDWFRAGKLARESE
jgi:hypothetical protein